MRDKLSSRRESSQIKFLREQSMCDAIASRLTSDDNDRLARAKRGYSLASKLGPIVFGACPTIVRRGASASKSHSLAVVT